MRFYEGWFNLYQTISGLPQGHYRLSVQAFYRDGSNESAWNARKNGEESLDAYIYAGDDVQAVVSIYSESLSYNAANNCWSPGDESYYPNGSDGSAVAFEDGLYWNTMEFDVAGGSLTIGVGCDVRKGSNYAVFDNFKLEYYGEIPEDSKPDEPTPSDDGWTDVTAYLLTNPDFNDGSSFGWDVVNNAANHQLDYGAIEFWQGTFNLSQHLTGLPSGKYRLSVQGFYRTGSNESSYYNYKNETEDLTALLYAGTVSTPMMSRYVYELGSWMYGCWQSGQHYYPNNMYTASVAFADGDYWNKLEFNASGDITIGVKNDNWVAENWCIFDNFKLEYQGTIVKATSVTTTLQEEEILIGQQVTATATVLPANALVKKVKWTSSDVTVATVSSTGVIEGVGEGTATITATTIDGSAKSSSLTLKVTKNAPTAESLIINEIMASNVDEFFSPAYNFDGWIELYNPSDKSVTLKDCCLSDDAGNLLKWRMPAALGYLPAGGYKVIFFDSNDIAPENATFKLDVDGGSVFISDDSGRLIAQQAYPASMERVSYARTTDGGAVWGLCGTATPGASNATGTFAAEQLEAPAVDQPSQLFTGQLSVQVTIPTGCQLRFTTDGSLPTLTNGETSTTGRFTVSSTTNYRFRFFASGMLPSRVTSRSYIKKDRNYTLPVVSVVTDPEFLYSSEYGVFEKGPNGRPGNGEDDKCNWNMNWERPVNFSYLDADGQMVLNQDANLEMCGGWSRAWWPHAFKLKGNKELGGTKYLPYPFFSQKPYIRNRTLQIRNGGNDTQCRFKDPALQYIVETSGVNIDCQSYQPVHEFVNGEYIGVLNVREPNNKHFVYSNYGWDDDEIEQFEMSPDSGYVQKCGTADAFIHLVDDLSPNAADDKVYEEICQLLDIDEYANYMAAEFYLGNWDWPQNNVKGFRHAGDGKFRFVLFDLDGSFSTSTAFDTFRGKETYTFDELRPHGTGLGRITAQIRFVTLFQNLIQNSTFRKRFIDAFCLMGGSVFEASRATDIIDSLEEAVSGPMSLNGGSPSNTAGEVRNRLKKRLNIAMSDLRSNSDMQLSGVNTIEAALSANIDAAKLQLNGHDIPTGKFNGQLLAPAVMTVQAPEGYVFKGWQDGSGNVLSSQETYDISDLSSVTMTAVYEPLTADAALLADLAMPIKVNEVSAANTVYVGETWKHADWIELYNTTDTELDVKGLYLSDDIDQPLKFQIERSAKIPAKGHLVVWADGLGSQALDGLGSQVHTSFKLSNADNQSVLAVSSAQFVEANAAYFDKHSGLKSFIDGLTYKTHGGTESVGRYPDGGKTFYRMTHPTIERTNTLLSTDQPTGTDQSLMALTNNDFALQLEKGWNWTSHCLETPIAASDLSAYATRIVGQNQEVYRVSGQGMAGNLKTMEAGRLYKVNMRIADTYTSTAAHCRQNQPIMLLPGWNWVGYTANGTQTLQTALSDFTAEEGDLLVGQDGFATYSDGSWKGTLTSVETGKGYMLYTQQAKTLTFHSPTLSINLSRRNVKGQTARDFGIDKHGYPNVMGMVASLQWQNETVEPGRFTLLAFADGECRGAGKWVGEHVFLTTYGQGGEPLQLVAVDELDGTSYTVDSQPLFAAGVSGSPRRPVVLNIGDAQPTGLHFAVTGESATGTAVTGYYSLSGVCVASHAARLAKGAYIVKYQNGTARKMYIK